MVQKVEEACYQKRSLRRFVWQKTTHDRILGRFVVQWHTPSDWRLPVVGDWLTG
jgi:hypothetical protein